MKLNSRISLNCLRYFMGKIHGVEKGDISFKYRPPQAKWLRNKGYLDELESDDDF